MAKLSGMKAICTYINRSEATVLGWIRDLGFPAKKLGGIWESTTDLADKWHLEQLEGPAMPAVARLKKPPEPRLTTR